MEGIRQKAEGGREEARGLTPAERQGLASVPVEKEEGEEKKRCKKCGGVKPLGEFSKNKTMKDGYENRCRGCKEKRRKELERERTATAETQGLASPRDDGRIRASLVINFTGHIDVLEKITKDASANFRTPELQALFLLAGKGNDYDR